MLKKITKMFGIKIRFEKINSRNNKKYNKEYKKYKIY